MKRKSAKEFYNVSVIERELPEQIQTEHGKTVVDLDMDDIEKFFPEAISYDSDGNKSDWYVDVVVAAMLAMVQDLKTEVDSLAQEVGALKVRLERKDANEIQLVSEV